MHKHTDDHTSLESPKIYSSTGKKFQNHNPKASLLRYNPQQSYKVSEVYPYPKRTHAVFKPCWLRIIWNNIWNSVAAEPKSSRRSTKAQSCRRGAVRDCFLSCFKLPLQSLSAGCGDFEILSILNPPQRCTSQGRRDANKKISLSFEGDVSGGERRRMCWTSDVLRNISFVNFSS